MNAQTEFLLQAGPAGRIEVAIDQPEGTPRGVAVIAHPHPLHGGTLTNNTLDLGDMPQSQDKSNIFVQTSIDKQVNLVNANGVTLQFWDGAAVGESHGASGIEGNNKIDGGDGKWMAIGDAGDDNWTTATGVGNAPWAQKSFAVFTATPGTVMVDAAAGAVPRPRPRQDAGFEL